MARIRNRPIRSREHLILLFVDCRLLILSCLNVNNFTLLIGSSKRVGECPDTHERSSCDVPHQCFKCLEGMSSLRSTLPCRFGCRTGSAIDVLICRKDICIRILPSEVETRQQSSSEMIIPVSELLTLQFGKGHVSELNILINRPYNV